MDTIQTVRGEVRGTTGTMPMPVSDAVREAQQVRDEAHEQREKALSAAHAEVEALRERLQMIDAQREQALAAWTDASEHLRVMLEAAERAVASLTGEAAVAVAVPERF
jgi:hypothetical protein